MKMPYVVAGLVLDFVWVLLAASLPGTRNMLPQRSSSRGQDKACEYMKGNDEFAESVPEWVRLYLESINLNDYYVYK